MDWQWTGKLWQALASSGKLWQALASSGNGLAMDWQAKLSGNH